ERFRVLPGDLFHANDAFCAGHVRERLTRSDVADRVITRHVRLVEFVHLDPALVGHDADLFKTDLLDVRRDAYGAENDVAIDRLIAFRGLYGDLAHLALGVNGGHFRSGHHFDALL